MPIAALVNGTAAHALELDDFGGCGHSGAVVVPVVCALAARGGVSGREAIVAILAGYDLAARVLDGSGRLPAAQRARLAFDRDLRQLRRGRGGGAHARPRPRAFRRRARHRRHLHRRRLGVPRRRRRHQALPPGQDRRERADRGPARARRHERPAPDPRSGLGRLLRHLLARHRDAGADARRARHARSASTARA